MKLIACSNPNCNFYSYNEDDFYSIDLIGPNTLSEESVVEKAMFCKACMTAITHNIVINYCSLKKKTCKQLKDSYSDIYDDRMRGMTYTDIAAKYHTTASTVTRIVNKFSKESTKPVCVKSISMYDAILLQAKVNTNLCNMEEAADSIYTTVNVLQDIFKYYKYDYEAALRQFSRLYSEGKSVDDIAKIVHFPKEVIIPLLNKLVAEDSKRRDLYVGNNTVTEEHGIVRPIKLDTGLIKSFAANGWSYEDIAESFCCDVSDIEYVLKQ